MNNLDKFFQDVEDLKLDIMEDQIKWGKHFKHKSETAKSMQEKIKAEKFRNCCKNIYYCIKEM